MTLPQLLLWFAVASLCLVGGSLAGGSLAGGPTPEQKRTSKDLLDASQLCYDDVHDKAMKYASSPNCAVLGQLVVLYYQAGGSHGPDEGVPLEVQINYERARLKAWMAWALAKDRSARIW